MLSVKQCCENSFRDRRCAYTIIYTLIKDIIPKSKKLSAHDKEVIQGILKGGKYNVYFEPFAWWIDFAYQSDYFPDVQPLPYCEELDYEFKSDSSTPHDRIVSTRNFLGVKPMYGVRLCQLVCGEIGDFDDFISSPEGQEILKGLTGYLLFWDVTHLIVDIGILVFLAVLLGVIQGVAEWLKGLKLPQWLLTALLSLLGIGENAVKNQIELTKQTIQELANAIAGDNQILISAFNAGLEQLYGSITSLTDNMKNAVKSTLDDITTAFKEIYDNITDVITKTTDDIIKAITNTNNEVKTAIIEKTDEISKKIDNITSGVIKINLTELLGV